jgi:hypothetical protein
VERAKQSNDRLVRLPSNRLRHNRPIL